jgi:hypothetical protein
MNKRRGEGLHDQSLDMQGDGEGVWVLLYLELMVFLAVCLVGQTIASYLTSTLPNPCNRCETNDEPCTI